MSRILQERLNSSDLEVQISALNEAIHVVREIVEAAVRGIEHSSEPILTCEALYKFGPILNEYLLGELEKDLPQRVKFAMSLLLLRLGLKDGVEYVQEELINRGSWQFLAATALADAHIFEAQFALFENLRDLTRTSKYHRESAPKFQALINALKKLGVSPPDDIKDQLLAEGIPREISRTLD